MRYLKISLLIGLLVSLAVSALMYFGALVAPDSQLCELVNLPPERATELHTFQFAVIALCAFGIAWTTVDITRPDLKWVIAMLALIEITAMLFVASLFGVFFSPLPGGLAILFSFLAGLLYARSDPGKRKLHLRQMIGSRISERQFTRFLDDKSPIRFDGHTRNASVVVCRVFSHDQLMDGVDPPRYVEMINRWLGTASEFLVGQGGYLDECNGEGVRCVFGGIMDEPDHQSLALDTAIELDKRLRNLNGEIETEWHRTLDYAISLNSGDMVAAAYGGRPLSSFSVSGDVVDFAWRLPRIAHDYHVTLAVGHNTFVACEREFIFRPIDLVYGTDGMPVEIYQPLGRKGEVTEAASRSAADFWQAVVLIREGETTMAREFLNDMDKEDPLVSHYLDRIEDIQSGRVSLRQNIRSLTDSASG